MLCFGGGSMEEEGERGPAIGGGGGRVKEIFLYPHLFKQRLYCFAFIQMSLAEGLGKYILPQAPVMCSVDKCKPAVGNRDGSKAGHRVVGTPCLSIDQTAR